MRYILIPGLKPGQIVITDNASIHKSETTKNLIEAAGCKLVFLPPYSPDLNPIEHFWVELTKETIAIYYAAIRNISRGNVCGLFIGERL